MRLGLGFNEDDLTFAAVFVGVPSDPEGHLDSEDWDNWMADVESTAEWARFTRVAEESSEGAGTDPGLAMLRELEEMSEGLARKKRHLVAYMRERSRSPHKLRELAEATNMSVSGIRTLYSAEDLHQIDESIAKAKNALAAREEGSGYRPYEATPIGELILNHLKTSRAAE